MAQVIKWGILGAGRIAAKFASDINKTPNCVVHAVASSSLEKAQQFALDHQGKLAFGNYHELFTSGVDVIYVATPHTFHKQHTLLCLENNIPVLCEKPFGINEPEVLEMIKMAREKKIFLMEAMWTKFLPSSLKTLELINSGLIGKIKTIDANFGFKAVFDEHSRLFNPTLGGGAFLDIGIYPAFLSLFLLGYPSKISASSIFAPTGTDETTSFIYQYDNETTALLNCTVGANTNCEANIYGEKGSITIHGRFHEAQEISVKSNDTDELQTFSFPRNTFGYNYEIEEVNACLRAGKIESDILPLSFSQKLIHLLDKTREAAQIVYR
jgi:predicted dehydrogenase